MKRRPLFKCVAALLSVTVPMAVLAAAEKQPSYKIIYDGGSLPEFKAGTDMRLYIDSNKIRLVKDNKAEGEVLVIPAAAVTEISYGQDVHRRVGAAIGLAVISWVSGHSCCWQNPRNTT